MSKSLHQQSGPSRGAVVAGCTLLEEVGRGGSGAVWHARSAKGREVAVKILLARDREKVERMLREVRVQASLRSENIVKVLGSGDSGGRPVLVMELVRGRSLYQFLRTERLTMEQLDQVADGIFNGVAAAHSAGLVHRDLKPGNILICEKDGRLVPKITDFGLVRELRAARQGDNLTMEGFAIGTPGFMSPEQIRGLAEIDRRSDLFSLGAVLYNLCTGRMPFRSADRYEMLKKTCQGDYLPPEELASWLPYRITRAIEAALEPVPEDRVPSIRQLRAIWFDEEGEATDLIPIRSRQAKGGGSETQPIRKMSVGPPPTPRPKGPTFGRKKALSALADQLAGFPLVTVVGTGGVGKTRLALEAARLSDLPTAFCDLSSARDTKGLHRVLGAALSIRLTGQGGRETLGDGLRSMGSRLLILDNAEHIVPAVAQLLGFLTSRAPRARFLVTSRTRLGIEGEAVCHVKPLQPADAMRLFEDRARRVCPGFSIDERNRGQVLSLVDKVGHVALAVELAAARVRELGLSALDESLEGLGSLSVDGKRVRHDALDSTVEWSWALLAPWERQALLHCSVFRGGFTIDAAEEVVDLSPWPDAPWVMDVLHSLVESSLLHASDVGASGRLHMYEAVADYAARRMAASGGLSGPRGADLTGADALLTLRRRHAAHFSRYGGDLSENPLPKALVGRLLMGLEAENFLTAVEACLEQALVEESAGCAQAYSKVNRRIGPYIEGAAILGSVLAECPQPPYRRARLLQSRGLLLRHCGRNAPARRHLEAACEIYSQLGNSFRMAESQGLLASICRIEGDLEGALSLYGEALGVFRAAGADQAANILDYIAQVRSSQGRIELALKRYEEALAMRRAGGSRRGEGTTLRNMANLFMRQGRLTEAERAYKSALRINREVREVGDEAVTLANLGVLLHEKGESEEALTMLGEAARLCHQLGQVRFEAMSVGNMGDILYGMGRLEEAEERLRQAVEQLTGVWRVGCGAFQGSLALVLAVCGRMEEATPLLNEAEAALRGGDALELAKLLCKKGRIHLLAEEVGLAVSALDEAVRNSEGSSAESEVARMVQTLRADIAESRRESAETSNI
jgi:predicted ATPase